VENMEKKKLMKPIVKTEELVKYEKEDFPERCCKGYSWCIAYVI
jgi:hypothetical protein